MNIITRNVFSGVLLLLLNFQNAEAAILLTNGIAPFDINLGTLTQVLVILDPVPVQTSPHITSFNTISPHIHFVNPPPVSLTGLGSFPFAPVLTSPASSGIFDSHSHAVNLLPSVKIYSGGNLNWFLNPANATINSVPMPIFPTSMNENHNHLVQPLPIVPRTVYTFDPIPEPATLAMACLSGLAFVFQQRRTSAKSGGRRM